MSCCIIKRDQTGEIISWLIATDCHDARRQAEAAGERDLATVLYRNEFLPPSGQHEMPINPWGMPRYTMLVSPES